MKKMPALAHFVKNVCNCLSASFKIRICVRWRQRRSKQLSKWNEREREREREAWLTDTNDAENWLAECMDQKNMSTEKDKKMWHCCLTRMGTPRETSYYILKIRYHILSIPTVLDSCKAEQVNLGSGHIIYVCSKQANYLDWLLFDTHLTASN